MKGRTEEHMKCARKIGLLLVILTLSITGMAYADGGNFRIRIQDDQGNTVVISGDPTTLGTVWADTSNSAGVSVLQIVSDQILFEGTIGNYYTDLSFAYTDTGAGYGILSLSSYVGSNGAGPGSLQITLEDSGYLQPPAGTANFHGLLSGADSDLNDLVTLTLFGGANSITAQSWINTANQDFDANGTFGSDGRSTTPPTPTLSVPVGSYTAFAGGNAGTTYTSTSAVACDPSIPSGTTCLAPDTQGGTVSLGSNGYAMFSQVTVNFASAGQAGFTLDAQTGAGASGPPLVAVSAPEPASLLLLGSGLVGLGFLRRKQGRTL